MAALASEGSGPSVNASVEQPEQPERQEVIQLLVQRALGPLGETVLDPVLAELYFVSRWRKLPLRVLSSHYPTAAVVGPLPASIDGALGVFVPRHALLASLAAFDQEGYGQQLNADDVAFCSFIRARLGEALNALLWTDDGVWDDYTRKTLVKSSPYGFGWSVAWAERRRRLAGVQATGFADGNKEAALLGLPTALEALAQRLDGADTFGEKDPSGISERRAITRLDACAFGHLSVLYSIPCEENSNLHVLLARFPTLSAFCDRMEARLRSWPDSRSFLAAVPPQRRLPGVQGSIVGGGAADAAQSVGNSHTTRRIPAWWELWGWSRGSGKPAKSKAHQQTPAAWHAIVFGFLTVASATVAITLGFGPPLGRYRSAFMKGLLQQP